LGYPSEAERRHFDDDTPFAVVQLARLNRPAERQDASQVVQLQGCAAREAARIEEKIARGSFRGASEQALREHLGRFLKGMSEHVSPRPRFEGEGLA
jgi:hypothetical protein